ncbi:hypothetical protein GCM10009801_70740 [Streptomyces albiaxialis]|uniref:Uncharacterized protein n=1 Tax=Streptomyces albiaxialis TaxID=329523 RepID=A0ABN2WVW1_9ACTN
MLGQLALELRGIGRGVHQCLDRELVAGTGPATRHGIGPDQRLLRRLRRPLLVARPVPAAARAPLRRLHGLDARGLLPALVLVLILVLVLVVLILVLVVLRLVLRRLRLLRRPGLLRLRVLAGRGGEVEAIEERGVSAGTLMTASVRRRTSWGRCHVSSSHYGRSGRCVFLRDCPCCFNAPARHRVPALYGAETQCALPVGFPRPS